MKSQSITRIFMMLQPSENQVCVHTIQWKSQICRDIWVVDWPTDIVGLWAKLLKMYFRNSAAGSQSYFLSFLILTSWRNTRTRIIWKDTLPLNFFKSYKLNYICFLKSWNKTTAILNGTCKNIVYLMSSTFSVLFAFAWNRCTYLTLHLHFYL